MVRMLERLRKRGAKDAREDAPPEGGNGSALALFDGVEKAQGSFAAYLETLQSKAPRPLPAGAMDDDGEGRGFKQAFSLSGDSGVSESLALWYARQGFIGHQLCAILSQHWLIDKACSRPAEDALRHGYKVILRGGREIPKDMALALTENDQRFNLKQKLFQFIRLGRVFGLVIAVFKVKSNDPQYYECPFNPDSVRPGSYQGISIVEPYWCIPQLDGGALYDPASLDFYTPEWWQIGHRRYHRSHLMVFSHNETPDILKPVYLYGGVSIPQKIMERVYAAERTANEAPALAMSKRTTIFKTDVESAMSSMGEFMRRMQKWIEFRDNHSVKIADKETEDLAQFDTTLADFDELMMSQYQLVAAAAEVPATKLLGTPPKGFNATGAHEEKSYHETLESIQETHAAPFLERHYRLLALSGYGRDMPVSIAWNPVDAPTSREYAEIRKMNVEADLMLAEAGVVEAGEIREKLKADENSGFANLEEVNPGELEAEIAALREAAGMDEKEEFFRSIKKAADAGEFREPEHHRDKEGR